MIDRWNSDPNASPGTPFQQVVAEFSENAKYLATRQESPARIQIRSVNSRDEVFAIVLPDSQKLPPFAISNEGRLAWGNNTQDGVRIQSTQDEEATVVIARDHPPLFWVLPAALHTIGFFLCAWIGSRTLEPPKTPQPQIGFARILGGTFILLIICTSTCRLAPRLPPWSSQTKWMIGFAIVAGLCFGLATIAHGLRDQNGKLLFKPTEPH